MGGYRLIGILVVGQLLLHGCRLNPSDDTIPGAGAPVGEEKWQKLAQALGLQESADAGSDPDLVLANPLLGSIADQLGKELAKTPGTARCAGIHDFQRAAVTASVAGVSVYRLEYSLQGNSEGQEASVRTGLVVIPDDGAPFSLPLVAFAHGSENGLAYGDIAGFLQQILAKLSG